VVQPDASSCALNTPVMMEEVLAAVRTLPNGKAADLNGLTCELLKYAAMPAARVQQSEGSGEARALLHGGRSQVAPADTDLVSLPLLQCLQ
jgi:hypothetical protein